MLSKRHGWCAVKEAERGPHDYRKCAWMQRPLPEASKSDIINVRVALHIFIARARVAQDLGLLVFSKFSPLVLGSERVVVYHCGRLTSDLNLDFDQV